LPAAGVLGSARKTTRMKTSERTSGRWLTREEAARHPRISLPTFDRRRSEGLYPTASRSSPRRPLWSVDELDAELDGATAKSNRHADPIMALIDAE
jgi:hypothetical protein